MDNEMGSLGNLDFKDLLAIMLEGDDFTSWQKWIQYQAAILQAQKEASYAFQMTEWHITWPSDQYLFAFNMN